MDILRRQLAERAGRPDRGRMGGAPLSRTPAEQGQRLGQLRERIVERLRALPHDDPLREQRARRVLLESILVWEFGDEVHGDARFGELIEHVQTAMSAHAQSDRRLRELIADLSKA